MAYFGPEVLMPAASAAAGLAGLILMFWRKVVAVVRRLFRAAADVFRRGDAIDDSHEPGSRSVAGTPSDASTRGTGSTR